MPTIERHTYRIIRYIDQWPIGRQRKVERSGLTFDAAQRAFGEEDEHAKSQDLAIEDEATGEEVRLKPHFRNF